MCRSLFCSVLFVCALLAALAASAPAAYVVRIAALQYSPPPPNANTQAARFSVLTPAIFLRLGDLGLAATQASAIGLTKEVS